MPHVQLTILCLGLSLLLRGNVKPALYFVKEGSAIDFTVLPLSGIMLEGVQLQS